MKKAEFKTLNDIQFQPTAWSWAIERSTEIKQKFEETLNRTKPDLIYLVGAGSSYYVGLAAAPVIAEETGVPAVATPPSEIMLYGASYLASRKNLLAIHISRSGQTTEVLKAIERFKRGGAFNLALTCNPGSPVERKCDDVLVKVPYKESATVTTLSYTLQLLVLYLASGWKGKKLPLLGNEFLMSLKIPENEVKKRGFFVLGGGFLYGVAKEAAFKLMELAAWKEAVAYHSLEFRHGPHTTVGRGDIVYLLANPKSYKYEKNLVEFLTKNNIKVKVLAPRGLEFPAETVFINSKDLSLAFIYSLYFQKLGYQLAIKLKKNPDKPEGLLPFVKL